MPRSGSRRWAAKAKSDAQFAMKQPLASAHISSAALQKVKELKTTVVMPEGWQRDAYGYYLTIGELAQVLTETASSVARCELRPIESSDEAVPGGYRRSDDERVLRVWEAFQGARGGQSELVRRAALNLQIAGEVLLVGVPMKDQFGGDAGYEWNFLSCDEIRLESNGTVKRNYGYAGKPPVELPMDTYIARLWRSCPQYEERADCAVKHVLPICQEVILLTQVVDAIAKSRLSAGIIYVPDEMSFGPMDETEDDSDEIDEIDPFSQELMEQLTAPVEDRTSAASLVPLIMRGPAEYADKVKMIELARNLDHMYQDLRLEAIKRLATGLDVPVEIMFGKGGLNHWCFDTETKVLADDGWKGKDDLRVGDMVLTLNHDSGLSEWQPVLKVTAFEVGDLEMVSIEGDRHSSLTTPNHRWPVLKKVRENYSDPATGKKTSRVAGSERVWTTSEGLNSNDSIVVGAPSGDRPVEAKWSDEMVEVAAWLWTEGHIRVREGRPSPQMTIWQSHRVNQDNVARIRRALTGVFGPGLESLTDSNVGRPTGPRRDAAWSERVQPSRPDMTEFHLNASAADVMVGLFSDPSRKVLDLEFIHSLTCAQLELFIDASIRADGTILKTSGTMHITQSDAGRLAPLELAAILSGRSTHVYETKQNGTMLSISAKTTFGLNGKTTTQMPWSGTVWCPTTTNGTVCISRHGKVAFTGQTGYNIDSDFITKHIVPIGNMIAEFLTTAYLRPMLVTYEDMTEEEAHKFRLYFDPSKITSRSDAGQSALAAYDRRELSAVSFVRESGLSESDMPTRDERKERDLRSLMAAEPLSFGPQIMGMLYPELDGVIEVPMTPMDGTDNPAALPGPADGLPQRKNPTKPNSDPLIDNETGQGEPTPHDRVGPRLDEASLVRAIASLGDAALEEALEAAGSRIMGSMTGSLPVEGDRDRIRASLGRVHFSAMPSELSEMDKRAVGVNATFLSQMAQDPFSDAHRKVAGLLERHFVGGGLEEQRAKDAALHASAIYVNMLEAHLATALLRPPRPEANGLSVSDALVRQALLQAKTTI